MHEILSPFVGTGLTLACIGMILATSLAHSLLGERRLLGPLLAQRGGVLDSELARFLLRAVWHFMTLLFWILAMGLAAGLHSRDRAAFALLAAVAGGIGGAGIFDAVGSRGKHIGWPMLVLTGLLAGLALLTRL